MRSILIVCHRYLGIALALPFLLWFVSGFVIIYTGGMPRLTEADRLTHLPALDFNQVAVAPADAGNRVSSNSLPRLTTVMGRPAYRFTGSDSAVIFADNGERLSSAMVSSRNIVAQFIGEPAAAISRLGTLEEVDQWTIGLRNQLPLEKFAVRRSRLNSLRFRQRCSRGVAYKHHRSHSRLGGRHPPLVLLPATASEY